MLKEGRAELGSEKWLWRLSRWEEWEEKGIWREVLGGVCRFSGRQGGASCEGVLEAEGVRLLPLIGVATLTIPLLSTILLQPTNLGVSGKAGFTEHCSGQSSFQ